MTAWTAQSGMLAGASVPMDQADRRFVAGGGCVPFPLQGGKGTKEKGVGAIIPV